MFHYLEMRSTPVHRFHLQITITHLLHCRREALLLGCGARAPRGRRCSASRKLGLTQPKQQSARADEANRAPSSKVCIERPDTWCRRLACIRTPVLLFPTYPRPPEPPRLGSMLPDSTRREASRRPALAARATSEAAGQPTMPRMATRSAATVFARTLPALASAAPVPARRQLLDQLARRHATIALTRAPTPPRRGRRKTLAGARPSRSRTVRDQRVDSPRHPQQGSEASTRPSHRPGPPAF